MPRFHFHLFNGEMIADDEGIILPNDAVALQKAAVEARYMAAQDVIEGRLILDHRIEVRGDGGRNVGIVYFRDVVKVEG